MEAIKTKANQGWKGGGCFDPGAQLPAAEPAVGTWGPGKGRSAVSLRPPVDTGDWSPKAQPQQ